MRPKSSAMVIASNATASNLSITAANLRARKIAALMERLQESVLAPAS